MKEKLLERLKHWGYDIEVHIFGITVMYKGTIKFHGRTEEVIEWMKETGEWDFNG